MLSSSPFPLHRFCSKRGAQARSGSADIFRLRPLFALTILAEATEKSGVFPILPLLHTFVHLEVPHTDSQGPMSYTGKNARLLSADGICL